MKKTFILFVNQSLISKLICFLIISISFVKLSSAQTCVNNTWLNINGTNRPYVDIGNIQISGQKLTIECLFNRTTAYDPISNGGELVSNHCAPTDLNYLLRPNAAAIRTSNGYFVVQSDVEISLNTTYHVAMVYDGTTLKFYRNGVLLKQTPATGVLSSTSYSTKIGRTGCLVSVWPTDFIGYINEVRIWNIDRTQSQIQANMNTVMPNPGVQIGLQCYYTFNSLYNKVYNAISTAGTFNGSGLSINAVNPNPNINICDVPRNNPAPTPTPFSTNTFLKIGTANTGVNIGNLKIMGNQLTIEAVFTNTTQYDPTYLGGDLVSKHCNPKDVNYLLRPNQAFITTTNGQFQVLAQCNVEVNKTYHIAMIYDGARLKLYRNGWIVGDVPATGNLIDNSYDTKIGMTACAANPYPTTFFGYIDEVRIWNIARRIEELYKYEYIRLDFPTVQFNLLAYYTFNSLSNKQGNAIYNGTIIGNALINQVNNFSNNYGTQGGCALPRVSTGEITLRNTSDISAVNEGDDKITPNPAKSYIKINSSCNNCLASVIDNLGTVVKSFKLVSGLNNIYIGNLPKGVYFLKKVEKGKIVTKKLIKL